MNKKNINNLPETAEFQEDVERILSPEQKEVLWFVLKKGDVEFKIGLSDILKCLKFAEEQGEVPELPIDWWDSMADLYSMDELRTIPI